MVLVFKMKTKNFKFSANFGIDLNGPTAIREIPRTVCSGVASGLSLIPSLNC